MKEVCNSCFNCFLAPSRTVDNNKQDVFSTPQCVKGVEGFSRYNIFTFTCSKYKRAYEPIIDIHGEV